MRLTRAVGSIDWSRTVDATDVALSTAAVITGTVFGLIIAAVLR